ncbi:LysR family transcriptional regulator [Vibrio cincinnatiensis]|uniref:DNA-binding transcriptional regulator, LysR family n=1 Tax=Vibrio cincinnatiensis DSM 19608 TaxID=1123491 RepID=A0A1T4S0F9_VIBCI|nr:LysR family transcriptional regulator [Vibrio cincinnatiensis]MCG3736640.1 LysR family transcriptional regulator [Vibrio cincinnatiensis]MCG3747112.1 LysR family transcriptional regulator [Vibrio cincinnatiensis]SKA21586.1 DNA-binding transcriptional regulator, LysR family [Vibrio cincinnatiensis DSM 19608]SUP06703.1 LysR family transcriptional regulator [Vibrio cincinnatiensis]
MKWARRLRVKHLQLLVTLGETGSLSETARLTHTTQPALSRWLKDLEDDAKGLIFERHARGLSPTVIGEMLIAHAKRILTETDRAQQNLNAVINGQARTIIVGTSPASAPSFVPGTLSRFLAMFPSARVELYESTMDSLMSKLKLGQLDLIIGRLDNYKPDGELQSELLYEEQLKVVTRLTHPLASQAQVHWEEVYQYDWIVWPMGTPIRSKLDQALTVAGRKPPVYRVESNSQVGNLWLLQNTDMISIVSESVAAHFNERGLLKALNIDLGTDAGIVGMVWREQAQPDQLMEQLIECCREASQCLLSSYSNTCPPLLT